MSSKQRKTCIITAIFILLITFLPFSGFAMNDDSRETLVLLGNENLAPIVYNDNGISKGVVVDIAKAIGDKIGYEVNVVTVNWEQAKIWCLMVKLTDFFTSIRPPKEMNFMISHLLC